MKRLAFTGAFLAVGLGLTAFSSSHAATEKQSLSAQRKNRIAYLAYQVPVTTALYGAALPWALDAKSDRVILATPFLVAPFAFGAHLWYSRSRDFEDSHRKGTFYLSNAALYSAFAVPVSLMGDFDGETTWQVAAWTTMALYPLGVWGGYELGDSYVNQPGRIDNQARFAFGFGMLGFFSPYLYFENLKGNFENITRLGLGQSVALGAMGHFISSYYRQGEDIPEGVSTGILNHTLLLGASLGLGVAAVADASSPRPWIGGALLGGTLGFTEGLFFFNKRYDTKERGLYTALGGVAGGVFGLGLNFLFDNSPIRDKATYASIEVASTWAGYWATFWLTQGMEDKLGLNSASDSRWSLNLMPTMQPEFHDRPYSKLPEVGLRYTVPGLQMRF